MYIYLIAHNRAIRPCHPNHSMPLALILPRGDQWYFLRMYVCMVITYSRVWINRVRLPILLVVSWTGKINIPLSPCVPENLVSWDGFSRPVPRQPAHSPHSGWIWCLLTGFVPSSAAAPIYETAIRHRVSPEFIVSCNCVPMAFTAESPPAQGQ